VQQTLNWSGYATLNANNYTEVNMYFTVPILTPTRGKDTALSEWAGVGGPKMLVQAGIGTDIDARGKQIGIQKTTAWWELFGEGVQGGRHPMNLAVNPGDQLWVYIGSNANHNGNNGYDGFLIEDLTTGTSQTAYYYDPKGFSDAQTAECIVERPVINGSSALLANFGHMTITGCGAYTNGQTQYAMAPIGNFPNGQINMVGQGAILASTSPLRNGADFDVTWKGTGNGT